MSMANDVFVIALMLVLGINQFAHSHTLLQTIPHSLSLSTLSSKIMSSEFSVQGDITFVETGRSFSTATAYVRLEDITEADLASKIVAEQVIRSLSHQQGGTEKILFNLQSQIFNGKADYIVSVHIDVDNDGQISEGDYINMESYPVLVVGHSSQVSVCVKQIT
jgi:uncharacterized lipoprotein YbaY